MRRVLGRGGHLWIAAIFYGLILAALWLGGFCGTVWAAGDWGGTWQTHWRGGSGQLVLQQTDDRVTGRYPLYDGVVDGVVVVEGGGERLDGRWAIGQRSGSFVAVLGGDGNSFTGRSDDGEWWTGVRITHPVLQQHLSRATPRDAFTSFVVAGNLASAGLGDAWGRVADVVDFGALDGELSRIDKLARVRELFALVELTTFRTWAVPDPPAGATTMQLHLEQARSGAELPLTLRRGKDGSWRVQSPGGDELHTARVTLLAAYGGHAPPADAYLRQQSPRDTMRAFLVGMADWDGPGRAVALSTLDLSTMPELMRRANGQMSAQFLRRVLDHIGLIGLQSIPDDGGSREPYVHFVHAAGRIVIAPSGPAADAPWRFTAETVRTIPDLYLATERLPPPLAVPPGLIPPSTYFTLRSWVAERAPVLLKRAHTAEYWQLAAALLVFVTAIVLARFVAGLACRGLARLTHGAVQPRWFYWALVVVLVISAMSPLPGRLGLAEGFREYSLPAWGIVACIAAGFVGWHLLHTIGQLLEERARRSENQTDDILFMLLIGSAKLAVVVACALGVAFFLSIPTTNMLAGLGIGGLALAFASRETLSNIFGAGILVADRPFRRGDWIKAGDIEGSVESVGVRSTRVRTAQDSVVFIPNGKLADSTINNLGTRRYRLLKLSLPVTAGGTPEGLQAFTTAVRERIVTDPAFAGERTTVGLTGIGSTEISVEVKSYLTVQTDRAEADARHALLLDLVGLATRAGLVLGDGMTANDGSAAQ